MCCSNKAVLRYLSLYLTVELSLLVIPVVSTPIEVPQLPSSTNSEESIHNENMILRRQIRSTGSYSPFNSRRRSPRVLNRLMRPTLISESTNSLQWEGSEAVVEFKLANTTFVNLTRAFLNLTLFESSLNFPVTLLASVTSASSTGSPPTESVVNLGSLVAIPGHNTITFDVLPFIQNITSVQSSGSLASGSSQGNPQAVKKVRLVFQIRRQSNNIDTTEFPPVLDILTRIPFLLFNYGNSLTELQNVDELLLAMTRRQSS